MCVCVYRRVGGWVWVCGLCVCMCMCDVCVVCVVLVCMCIWCGWFGHLLLLYILDPCSCFNGTRITSLSQGPLMALSGYVVMSWWCHVMSVMSCWCHGDVMLLWVLAFTSAQGYCISSIRCRGYWLFLHVTLSGYHACTRAVTIIRKQCLLILVQILRKNLL